MSPRSEEERERARLEREARRAERADRAAATERPHARERVEAALARTRNRLAPAERRHCARIATPRRRREFLAGRWLVETSRSQLPKDRWQRSIAHSGGWVACVLVQGARPGIDIEPMVERDFAKLGAWAFPADADQPWSREAFYGRWTRYEAKLKAAPQRPLVDVTWFTDGVALSVILLSGYIILGAATLALALFGLAAEAWGRLLGLRGGPRDATTPGAEAA